MCCCSRLKCKFKFISVHMSNQHSRWCRRSDWDIVKERMNGRSSSLAKPCPRSGVQDTRYKRNSVRSDACLVSFHITSGHIISESERTCHARGPGRFLVIGRPAPTCIMGYEWCRSICRRNRPKGANERARCEVAGDWQRSAMKR